MAGATGTSAIGGLISGLDTGTLIDQLIAVSRKRVDLVVSNRELQSDKLSALQSLNTQILSFQSAAETLKDSDTFDVFKTSSSTTSSTYTADELVGISATKDASPGTHSISFSSVAGASQLAKARQLSSQSFTSATTDLNITGEFVINGKGISVSTTDSLSDIVATINTANSGTDATGITASLISVSDTDNRMVLTSDSTGEDAFTLLDASSTNILEGSTGLGLASSTKSIKNTTSDGAKSEVFSSSTTAVGTLLGLSSAQNSSSILIATLAVANINLSTDSLSDIATTIDAVAGVTASVVSTTTDGVTTYQLDISGTTNFVDDTNILETLGILERAQSSVAEVHTGSKANEASAVAIVGTTKFNAIDVTGSIAVSDTITISGTDHDGNAVSGSYTITDPAVNDIDALLAEIVDIFDFVNVANTVTASVDGNGKIVITDTNTNLGDSQLSVSIVANNEGGGTLDFGAVSVTTEGYAMQATAGQDAKVTIDGVSVTRSSNTIDDVISGVTLDLNRVEAGETVNLTISRDTDNIKDKVTAFTDAYNEIIENINQQFAYSEETKSAGLLSGESTLRTIKSIIQNTVSNKINLLPTDANALPLFGITSDKNGKLSVDDTAFLAEINSDFYAVKRMFVAEGTTTDNEISYISHTDNTVAGNYDVIINTVASQATVTGTTDLSGGAGSTGSLTITDTSTSRVATVSITNGDSLDTIVDTINSELATERTQTLAGDVANLASASAITASTLFSAFDTGGAGLQNNDTIPFTGTNRSGISISDTYTISNVSTDTVQGFLSAIENAYDNAVSATIDTTGRIVVTDNTAGDSQISIDITEPGSLNFGTVLVSNTAQGGVTGRYAMEITASKSGSNLVLTHDNYGSGYGFSTSEDVSLLGSSADETGVDVVGSINGEAATGTGHLLVGDAPPDADSSTSVEGLAIRVTTASLTTPPENKGKVNLTMGVGELMYRGVDSITDQYDGLLTIRMDGIQDTIDDMSKSILASEERLAMEALRLNKQFVALELNLSKLQSVSSFMAQQLSQFSK
ncbi:MAG: flagellar filament capping protein FliD [Candidatus Scalindua sp.]|nr:flagellar filament capping protein FliD [Candidatus Scalindua sp.]